MRLAFAPYRLHFKNPAGTSRGVLTEKLTYFIKLWDEKSPEVFGIGEAPLFQGLSLEDNPRYEYKMIELLANIALGRDTDLSQHSSIQFGLEQAIRDLVSGGKGLYYPSSFTEGKQEIQINGLVWMGDYDEMLQRLDQKIAEGFRCIKFKIGAIDWKLEKEMISKIRTKYSEKELIIRVDANGGFSMDNVIPVLSQLADLGVHSIEQPIPAGYPELMAFLCKISPVPIALDEELIRITGEKEREVLLKGIMPAYIILKPALCGGFSGAEEWMRIADEFGIGYWITSALESNVGLDAIAQWTATLNLEGAQGLGTGNLFTNNFTSPLFLKGDLLGYQKDMMLEHTQFTGLEWRE